MPESTLNIDAFCPVYAKYPPASGATALGSVIRF
jgi:hypothetical protein